MYEEKKKVENDILRPSRLKILEVINETNDVKTFIVDNSNRFIIHKPGQIALLTPEFGSGEIAISISSSPQKEGTIDFSVKKVGVVTDILHRMEPNDFIWARGPYGRPFPMEELENKNLVFIGGGIGIAPLRSVINTVIAQRGKYRKIFIFYGARSSQDIVFKNELLIEWPKIKDSLVFCTVDKGSDDWTGKVGLVTELLNKENLTIDNTKVLICGPLVMMKFVIFNIRSLGFLSEDIITTLEMKMKCGVGKCGRCNIGSKYVCLDGPVFTLKELEKLPSEY